MRSVELFSVEDDAQVLRGKNPDFAAWAEGYGAIRHRAETQLRVYDMYQALTARHIAGDGVPFFKMLKALDRVTSAAMWLVAHMTYAKHVHLDGRPLQAEDFKSNPQGHMGGSLNMVPAYAGYLALNALTGCTRGWLMGQGQCVSAVDALNVLVGNMTPAHAERYGVSDAQRLRLFEKMFWQIVRRVSAFIALPQYAAPMREAASRIEAPARDSGILLAQ